MICSGVGGGLPVVDQWWPVVGRCWAVLALGLVVDPSMRQGEAMTAVIAHRGASAHARENTIEAFERAVELNADGIELDVRRTADGMLVVHHDAYLPDGRPIVELRRSDVPPEVPDLDAALEACAGVWVSVEIKNDETEPDFDPHRRVAAQVVELLESLGELDRWRISSFDLATLEEVRRLAPAALRTAWLVERPPAGAVEVLVRGGHHALHPWVAALERSTVDEVHAAGCAVNVWTCNDPVRLRELVDWGVDGVFTDMVDMARDIVDGTAGSAQG
jgi:glycerophosphoryl diester phosphodiesterase